MQIPSFLTYHKRGDEAAVVLRIERQPIQPAKRLPKSTAYCNSSILRVWPTPGESRR
jgi:hypothetical protein